MKYVYLAVRYVDLGYHALSAWGSREEAEAAVDMEFRADNAENRHVERKEYDVEQVAIGVHRLADSQNGDDAEECSPGRCGPQTEGKSMTNEQTIEAIMSHLDKAVDTDEISSHDYAAFRAAVSDVIYSASEQTGAALAAKDAEIAALKQRLADSERDLQAIKANPAPCEWVEWRGGECPIADGVRFKAEFISGEAYEDDVASDWDWRRVVRYVAL